MFEVSNDKYRTYGPENEMGMRRIQAVRSFANVKEGDIGGYIQDERNLSDRGTCWIYDDARVMGKARVKEDASVRGQVRVERDSCISGEANVDGSVHIVNTYIEDMADVNCQGLIDGCNISSYARVRGYVEMQDCTMSGHTVVEDSPKMLNVRLCNESRITGEANVARVRLSDECSIGDNSVVNGCELDGRVNVCGRSRLYDCELSGDITIDSTTLEEQRIDGKAFYKDGEDMQAKRSHMANDLIDAPSDETESSYASMFK